MMEIDGRTEVYGIIGWPVEHSLSPAMQNAAFRHFGMNACYVPWAVAPGELRRAVDGLRALGARGFNVTVPHKVEVVDYLDGVEGVAAELASVNVVANRDGALVGYNTDVEGFRLSLEGAEVKAAGLQVVVLGAGGAARSVVRALQLAGAEKIFLFNRTHEKAAALAEGLAPRGTPVSPMKFSDPGARDILRDCAMIINATSLGLRKDDPPPIDPGVIHSGHTLVDLIYRPARTAFLGAGEAKGARTVNGYGMLAHQAREAFRIWTGRVPPLEVMWNAGAAPGDA